MNLPRSRREFLIAMAAVPILAHAEGSAETVTPVRIAPLAEPGEPLALSGVVYQADGVTPAAGARIFAYHTDRFGIYSPRTDREPKYVARLKAYFSADDRGRYSIATIRPASYPNSTINAHIHVHVAPKGTSEEALFDYSSAVPNFLFAGDRFLSAREHEEARALGRFNYVVDLAQVNGRAVGVRHMRIGQSR